MGGDPLLEQLTERQPRSGIGAQDGVPRPDDLERARVLRERRRQGLLEQAVLAPRERLRTRSGDAVLVGLAPVRLVGDDFARRIDERADAVCKGSPRWSTRLSVSFAAATRSVPTRVPTHDL